MPFLFFFFFAGTAWGLGKVLLRSRKSEVCVDAPSWDGWEWQGWICPSQPSLTHLGLTPGHPRVELAPSFPPWSCRKRCLGATQSLCSREKRVWEQLPQVRDHWAPSDLWLVNHCRVLAGITGVNKEHFSGLVWISWKWELLSKASQPLLPFAWEVWGMNIDISNGFGINEHAHSCHNDPQISQNRLERE